MTRLQPTVRLMHDLLGERVRIKTRVWVTPDIVTIEEVYRRNVRTETDWIHLDDIEWLEALATTPTEGK